MKLTVHHRGVDVETIPDFQLVTSRLSTVECESAYHVNCGMEASGGNPLVT